MIDFGENEMQKNTKHMALDGMCRLCKNFGGSKVLPYAETKYKIQNTKKYFFCQLRQCLVRYADENEIQNGSFCLFRFVSLFRDKNRPQICLDKIV